MNHKRVHLKVSGRVQGVFYRASTQKKAIALDIVGWVRNCSDGSVEIEAQASAESIEQFIEWCKVGPQLAHVQNISIKEEEVKPELTSFDIIR